MSAASDHPIHVLIVDDSPIFSEGLKLLIETDPLLHVVGVARDGEQAVTMVEKLKPDVITMDLRMPRLGGLEAIDRIMAVRPTPILVLSAAEELLDETFGQKLRDHGAGGVRPKPRFEDAAFAFAEMREQLKALAVRGVAARQKQRSPTFPAGRLATPTLDPLDTPRVPIAALVASTGGPSTVAKILAGLTSDLPCAVLVVQHMMPGFSDHLASFFGQRSHLPVEVAKHGVVPVVGRVYVAPDVAHLRVGADGRLELDRDTPPVRGHRPSGTTLLQSLARSHGHRGLGVVLSGMGDDGSEGLMELMQAGGTTVAQDAASAVVDGMPRAARERGAVQVSLPHLQMARFIVSWAEAIQRGQKK